MGDGRRFHCLGNFCYVAIQITAKYFAWSRLVRIKVFTIKTNKYLRSLRTHAHTHKRIDTYLCAYILWADYVDVMWNLLQSSDKVFATLDFIVKWLFEWLSYCFIYILHTRMCWRSMRQSFSYNWLKILSISAYVVVPLSHKFDQNYKRLARVRLG